MSLLKTQQPQQKQQLYNNFTFQCHVISMFHGPPAPLDWQQMKVIFHNCDYQQMEGMFYNCDWQQIGVTFYNCDHQQIGVIFHNCYWQQMQAMLYNCDRQQIAVTFINCDNQQIGVTLYNCDHSQTKLASDQSHVAYHDHKDQNQVLPTMNLYPITELVAAWRQQSYVD